VFAGSPHVSRPFLVETALQFLQASGFFQKSIVMITALGILGCFRFIVCSPSKEDKYITIVNAHLSLNPMESKGSKCRIELMEP
jgi:hypothetical protein